MRSKYIAGVVSTGFLSSEVAIVFPELLNHKDVARKMGMSTITSAGFVALDVDKDKYIIQLYGESTSLEIASDPADTRLVASALGFGAYEWTLPL